MSLQASYYFDLELYEHKKLFEGCQFVWEALNNLEGYFRSFPNFRILENYPGVTFVNPEAIYIGSGSKIEAGAYIEGPCIIGKRCTIRHSAYLRKNVITGDDCIIGHCTELKHCILLNKASIAHLAYGGDSIFGKGCNLGAGVKCANFKFNGSSIVIHHEGKSYATNLRKFGAIVGDYSQLGCNSVTNPGTLLGKGTHLYPCTNFGGVALENSLIRQESKAAIFSRTLKKH